LILAHRNQRRPKRSDVRRLTYWIRKESRRDVPIKATQLDLATHGRIALESRERDEVEIQQSELRKLRNRRLERDRRDGRVDADGEVIQCDLQHVPAHVERTTRVVGERLQIRDQNRLVMDILERDAGSQRARVMTQVERAGRTIAREHVRQTRSRPPNKSG